ncbi:MAG: ThuA domain-containing protein [Cyclobacteriaceae bacterium]
MARSFLVILVLLTLFACETSSEADETKKIVLLAGPKSHPPGMHEYLKAVRLIKVALDNSNVNGIETEIHLDGWPEDASTLDDADLIVTLSDGYDGRVGDRYKHVPWETPERMEVMQRQMERGCGFSAIHFTTFMDDKKGAQILDWGGGYFDWQDDTGAPNWYSAIKTITTRITKESMANHPISNGVEPFDLKEEFYYNIRFKEDDPRLIPILSIGDLETTQENGQVVAWAIERENGGRGFSTTMGHYYANWKDDNFRKLMLNGLVWAAGVKVPESGVESGFYNDQEVTQMLFGKSKKGLILTGNDHPAHDWKAKTPVLKNIVETGTDIYMDVTTDPNDLYEYDLNDYDLILLNYCNWQDSVGLGEKARESFTDFLKNGGGLVVVHFANGAWHYSLPEAGSSDWPEYRKIVPRVWDHQAGSKHDKYGEFTVEKTDVTHPITEGTTSFKTIDELYYNQAGAIEIEPLLQARSNDTGEYVPMAWTFTYGKGRIFQTVLGHSVESLSTPEVQEIIRRGSVWVASQN